MNLGIISLRKKLLAFAIEKRLDFTSRTSECPCIFLCILGHSTAKKTQWTILNFLPISSKICCMFRGMLGMRNLLHFLGTES